MLNKYEEAADYLMGSCMMTAREALEALLERECTEVELTHFEIYLDRNEIFECSECGWWGYSGDIDCDCTDAE